MDREANRYFQRQVAVAEWVQLLDRSFHAQCGRQYSGGAQRIAVHLGRGRELEWLVQAMGTQFEPFLETSALHHCQLRCVWHRRWKLPAANWCKPQIQRVAIRVSARFRQILASSSAKLPQYPCPPVCTTRQPGSFGSRRHHAKPTGEDSGRRRGQLSPQ